MAQLAANALYWADMVVDNCFFVMQIYLTDVWKLSFTTAATFLNIWGGLYKILPFPFLFLAENFIGDIWTLGLSGILSTMGLVLITVTSITGYKCYSKGEDAECVTLTEKGIFIAGMSLLALGKAARLASSNFFIAYQTRNDYYYWWNLRFPIYFYILSFVPPVATSLAFPYVKKWYYIWGVALICTAFATLFYFLGFRGYERPQPGEDESDTPFNNFLRVFVAAAFKKSQPSPKLDDPRLYMKEDEEFKELSASRWLGFLHKAAIKLDEDETRQGEKRSWRLSSVSEVECAKLVIGMGRVSSTYIMCGVVSSIENTYFVEQATRMSFKIGRWKPPLQLFQIILLAFKFLTQYLFKYVYKEDNVGGVALSTSNAAAMFSILCCTVSAAVEGLRLHEVRRYDIVDDGEVPMSAFWLVFQVALLGIVHGLSTKGLSILHTIEAPRTIRGYSELLGDAVMGSGYMGGALSVYVVGKVSESGGRKNWFQHSLNKSHLDRYYWVLAVLLGIHLAFCGLIDIINRLQMRRRNSHKNVESPVVPLLENLESDNE